MKNIDEVIRTLWDRAESHLTFDEVHSLCHAGEEALLMASQLTTVCDAMGSLIAEDQVSGAFSDGDSVSQLMWLLARQVDAIQALSRLGERAKTQRDTLLGWSPFARQDAIERLKSSTTTKKQ